MPVILPKPCLHRISCSLKVKTREAVKGEEVFANNDYYLFSFLNSNCLIIKDYKKVGSIGVKQ